MAERYTQVPRASLSLVQGDDFVMGSADQPDSAPPFTVEVGSFYLGKATITNEQYQRLPAYERKPCSPGDDDPGAATRSTPRRCRASRGGPKGWHDCCLRDGNGRCYPLPAQDPDGPDVPGARVLRGGSFRTPLSEHGCAVRRAAHPEARSDDVGFRIVRSL